MQTGLLPSAPGEGRGPPPRHFVDPFAENDAHNGNVEEVDDDVLGGDYPEDHQENDEEEGYGSASDPNSESEHTSSDVNTAATRKRRQLASIGDSAMNTEAPTSAPKETPKTRMSKERKHDVLGSLRQRRQNTVETPTRAEKKSRAPAMDINMGSTDPDEDLMIFTPKKSSGNAAETTPSRRSNLRVELPLLSQEEEFRSSQPAPVSLLDSVVTPVRRQPSAVPPTGSRPREAVANVSSANAVATPTSRRGSAASPARSLSRVSATPTRGVTGDKATRLIHDPSADTRTNLLKRLNKSINAKVKADKVEKAAAKKTPKKTSRPKKKKDGVSGISPAAA